MSSNYGIAAALDVKGNLRVYDLYRYRKIGKLSCYHREEAEKRRMDQLVSKTVIPETACFRMLPHPCLEATADSLIAV